MTSSQWWRPNRHADRRPLLLQRGRVRTGAREFFEEQGFLEVECGALQTSPGCEVNLHAFATDRRWDDGEAQKLYLHTSPEFACKKLLAAGEERLFFLGPVYRNREDGPLHAPAFTMLEWYRANQPYQRVMDDCCKLAAMAQEACGVPALRWRDACCDAGAEPERLSVAEAFRSYAGLDLDRLIDVPETMADAADGAGMDVFADDDWSDLFSRILVRLIEPKLGDGRLTILDRYPAREAALAQPCADDPRYGERFEVYACGVELANGFGELTDAQLQRQRIEADMAEKLRRHGESWPVDEDFLDAVEILPASSGCALGFDRLVMLASGASKLDDVLWTPLTGR